MTLFTGVVVKLLISKADPFMTFSPKQYGGSSPWLQVIPVTMFIVVMIRPVRAAAIPNPATTSLGIDLQEKSGSCCRRKTQIGGKIKARGIAAIAPCNRERKSSDEWQKIK